MISATNDPTNADADPLRVMLLAPTGRDASLGCQVLAERGGFDCQPCASPDELCAELAAAGAGAVVLADEALTDEALRRLLGAITSQPTWSDLPIILMLERGRPDALTQDLVARLQGSANVTLLERPVRIVTLISAVESALRGRRRQYEVRALLREQEQAVRHRDQFLAMLGHELRNPLATITNAMALLQNNPSIRNTEEGEEARQIVRRQTRHLAQLVDDLLDVSRITSGKIVLRRSRVDLVELARQAALAVELAVKAQRHKLHLALPESGSRPIVVEGDSVRLEQVLSNLLSNAIKYTPPGGDIHVSVGVSDDGAAARLCVRDNGVGISHDLLPRVFDLFAQAEPTLDRAQGGMGIGLTLVRSLVELHGGSVTVKSDGPGTGSQFVISLPLVSESSTSIDAGGRDDARPRAGAVVTTVSGTLRPCAAETSHVLIVEDNVDARRAMQRLLQSWGHRVDVAEDGARRLALAATERPRVAVVDIGLPGFDGYHVARELRSILGPDAQLIAMTGYGQPDDKARARAAGFDMHLVKPVDPAMLRRALSP